MFLVKFQYAWFSDKIKSNRQIFFVFHSNFKKINLKTCDFVVYYEKSESAKQFSNFETLFGLFIESLRDESIVLVILYRTPAFVLCYCQSVLIIIWLEYQIYLSTFLMYQHGIQSIEAIRWRLFIILFTNSNNILLRLSRLPMQDYLMDQQVCLKLLITD